MIRILTLTLVMYAANARAADPFHKVTDDVNAKLVKLFGAGGFRGIANYGTGILISPDGHILTVASQMLDSAELVVHLSDGVKMKATVLVVEPLLDVALVKIKIEGKKPDEATGLNLPYFDYNAALKQPLAKPGDWVLALSNQFEIAMRDEPMTVQRGVVAAYTKMHGRRGIFDFPYDGNVYIVDAITNNPGAGGGALTTRKGELLGIVGKEIKNSLSETWMNYAIPLNAQVEVKDGDKLVKVTMTDFVNLGMQGKYKPIKRPAVEIGVGGYHGIRFVPNVLERTPPYVEEIVKGSPAEKAGIQIGDLVSFIDGEPIYSIKTFNEYMKKTRGGMRLRIEVRRENNLQTIELDLAEQPAKPVPAKP
ncbi:trypsin-like peptidase domain-containing protein [soil metagenome]